MAAESAKEFEALEAQALTLLDTFRNAGYEQVAPSIIQPADIFLDQIGESVRSRTYVFTDLAGDELCLRPDLTVPVSRLYLERHPKADRPARYCYNGPAFRFQPQGDNRAHPREFRQAGIECFGEADTESADVEIVLLAVEAVRGAGLKDFRLRFGDIGLFYALLDALALPERWRLKLRHYFWRPQAFHALLSRLARGERPNGDGPVMALAARVSGQSPERAEELVAAYLDQQGLPLSGNRSLGEITARLLDHAADLEADPLRKEVATVIDYYLAVSGPPLEAAERVAMIAHGAGINLVPALQAATRRFERLQKSGIDLKRARFAAEFGRNLEYYSGLVFQIETQGFDEAIAGGGRYDVLLTHLGAPRQVPAIGSAIHTERLLAAARGEQ
jgi:ATP phosphoribosyltransferase regulatory subunit